MKYYQIQESLIPVRDWKVRDDSPQYVAILNSEEWKIQNSIFDMFIDMDLETADKRETKAIVNFDSLTGCFSVPDRADISGTRHFFAFALDEKGIVLIDDEHYASSLVKKISQTKKWRLPCLERFLYDLLEEIIAGDIVLLENYETRLNQMEDKILGEQSSDFPVELNEIRGDLLDLRVHYEQLIDLGRELEENENGFFRSENLRYFRLFTERVIRLQETVTSLREYVIQIRDLVQSQLGVRQNKIITILTIITSIFMHLSLIAGWYGMNFRYMPELDWKYSYLVVIAVSVIIVIACLVWFRKKKWL